MQIPIDELNVGTVVSFGICKRNPTASVPKTTSAVVACRTSHSFLACLEVLFLGDFVLRELRLRCSIDTLFDNFVGEQGGRFSDNIFKSAFSILKSSSS